MSVTDAPIWWLQPFEIERLKIVLSIVGGLLLLVVLLKVRERYRRQKMSQKRWMEMQRKYRSERRA